VEAGVPDYENMRWTQVDVALWDTLRDVVRCVKEHGGAEYVLHLAGYYDFHNMEHPEYERTNVQGTQNILKLAQQLGVKRFIFASSLAACEFPPKGSSIDEDSPADATFAYARSKKKGEDLIRKYNDWFPSSIVRFAAVYSDWCEYPPLYIFLKTWLTKNWMAKILGGCGDSAIPYIHVRDLVKLFHRIIELNDELPRLATYNASPNSVASHEQLYLTATKYFYGETSKPVHMPILLAKVGMQLRWWLGKLRKRPPFEAPWMARYIDRSLQTDATRTHEALGWEPASRLDIMRRLLILIENMKSHSAAWHQRNEAALLRIGSRPNLLISFALEDMREEMVDSIARFVSGKKNAQQFCNYAEMEPETLRWFIMLVYQVLVTAVRTRDLQLIRNYAQIIALRRHQEGFEASTVMNFLDTVGRLISDELKTRSDMEGLSQHIHDTVTLSFGLAADGVEDAYEMLENQAPEFMANYQGLELPTTTGDLETMVRQLGDICEEGIPLGIKMNSNEN
jgi:nucleoside-diphosphate-sugar epimerase